MFTMKKLSPPPTRALWKWGRRESCAMVLSLKVRLSCLSSLSLPIWLLSSPLRKFRCRFPFVFHASHAFSWLVESCENAWPRLENKRKSSIKTLQLSLSHSFTLNMTMCYLWCKFRCPVPFRFSSEVTDFTTFVKNRENEWPRLENKRKSCIKPV